MKIRNCFCKYAIEDIRLRKYPIDPKAYLGPCSILNLSVMLGNYLQQTTSADDIFRCIFFLGALRVKLCITILHTLELCTSYFVHILSIFSRLLRGVELETSFHPKCIDVSRFG